MGGGDMMGRPRPAPKIPSFYRPGNPTVDFLDDTLYAEDALSHLFAIAEGPGRHNFSSMNSHLETLYVLGLISCGPIVECGVCQGSSTAAFLMAASESDMPVASYDLDPESRGRVHRNIDGIPLNFDWRFEAMDSVSAAGRHEDGSVGLLFLDSDHSQAHVKRELAAWLPKMRPDGIVAGHDYLGERGVKDAVDGFMAKPENAKRFKFQLIAADQGIWILWPRKN